MNMDFLDPRAKRAHRRRLKLGYMLMAVLIGLATLIFLRLSEGWFVDRKTGNLIQNGIVYLDSKPRGARIFLDGIPQNKSTDDRLVLPAGVYTVRLEAEGYRHWERTFNLEGGEIERLVYPLLIPNIFDTSDVAQYDVIPSLAMQSPDRRWVLIQKPGQTYQFDVFDLNDPEKSPRSIIVPPAILTTPGAEAELEMVEWSTDNRHVLISRTFEGSTEYIVLDHEKPEESININTLMGIKPATISLRDKKPDQFYYLEQTPGMLRVADTRNRTISAPLLTGVQAYKTYGDDIVLYVTEDVEDPSKAEFRILEGQKTYTLKRAGRSSRYMMDVSRYDGRWYYVVGSSDEGITYAYENPLPKLKGDDKNEQIVTLMRLDDPKFVSFSANTQYISVQNGGNLLVLDLEDKGQYRISLDYDIAPEQELKWMDGHRFLFSVDQQSYVLDFDGSNLQTLVTSRLNPGPFFDRDYDSVYTLEESKSDGSKKAFTKTILDE